ncbi:UDP-glucose 4-epimerase family protein [Spartinivicinus ruber]|uniref:UDP-glucose 4-epimerase family protein n=1 Tax=Spartinivicinus ruber TaxID=2683272 RepID=UPI0013D54035|nr:SDR family oxidoreductase [Spartinivicinus ruber]
MTNKVLVTGANGFIGKNVYSLLLNKSSINVRAAYRKNNSSGICVGNINGDTNWCEALQDVDVVIHTAARVHVLKEQEENPLSTFRTVNVEGTLNLARQAAANNVKRFIFISSIGVNGINSSNTPLTEKDIPTPHSNYAISKFEAEQGLRAIEKETGLEVVIIRPPLVYGPGAPGNIARFIKLLNKGYPLPFGRVENLRSLIAIDNLVDFIIKCIDHPKAAGELFLISDDFDISTAQLILYIAKALNKSIRLLSIPRWCLRFGLLLLRKKSLYQQLCGSLQIDITKAKTLLDWKPPVSMDVAVTRSVRL